MNIFSPVYEEPTPYDASTPKYRLAISDRKRGLFLYHGNCLDVMDAVSRKYPHGRFNMIFADPPYGLSNDGFTCVGGKSASVNKGGWDRFANRQEYIEFTERWLVLCKRVLLKDGTIWVSGTRHNIFLIGHILQNLGFKLLNDIVWEKPNPPPNLSRRYFTHSSEIILWASREQASRYTFNYGEMKRLNNGKQMKSVWQIPPPLKFEKDFGKHPTQKPLLLLERIIISSTNEGDFVFDPFCGSGTTGIAALKNGRAFCGVELEEKFISLCERRMASIYD